MTKYKEFSNIYDRNDLMLGTAQHILNIDDMIVQSIDESFNF